jgi:hypothetical protein
VHPDRCGRDVQHLPDFDGAEALQLNEIQDSPLLWRQGGHEPLELIHRAQELERVSPMGKSRRDAFPGELADATLVSSFDSRRISCFVSCDPISSGGELA